MSSIQQSTFIAHAAATFSSILRDGSGSAGQGDSDQGGIGTVQHPAYSGGGFALDSADSWSIDASPRYMGIQLTCALDYILISTVILRTCQSHGVRHARVGGMESL